MASLNSIDAKWDTKFHDLVAYKDTHGGSCNVPQRYAENPQLGNWVDTQRRQYKKFQQDPATSSMTQERIERLESIAFEWGVTFSAKWDTKFNELHGLRTNLRRPNHGVCGKGTASCQFKINKKKTDRSFFEFQEGRRGGRASKIKGRQRSALLWGRGAYDVYKMQKCKKKS